MRRCILLYWPSPVRLIHVTVIRIEIRGAIGNAQMFCIQGRRHDLGSAMPWSYICQAANKQLEKPRRGFYLSLSKNSGVRRCDGGFCPCHCEALSEFLLLYTRNAS